MSANIEMVNGVASFKSNKVAAWWDALNQYTVDGAMTLDEAFEVCNWTVSKKQLIDPVTHQPIEAWGIFRDDNGAFLGSVGARYTPIQNKFQFTSGDKILGEGGRHYETVGVIGKGEKVFLTAGLGEYDIHGQGDLHKGYFASVGSHDGNSSHKFFMTETRIVCQNTLQVALGNAKNMVNVRHTANAEARINAKLDVFQQTNMAFKDTMEKLEILAERRLTNEVMAQTIADIFKIEDLTKELSSQTLDRVNSINRLYELNDNNAFPQFRGTPYALFNAVTDDTDHLRPVRMTDGRQGMTVERVRAESAIFGTGSDFKARALDIILENTKFSQTRSLHKAYSLPANVDGASALDAVLSQY